MDAAYDHITEQAYTVNERATTPTPSSNSTDDAATPRASRQNLQTEFQETFRVFSNSAWGSRLGGFWGNVRKQGEVYLEEARKEAAEVVSEVETLRTKGFAGLGLGSETTETKDAAASEQQSDGPTSSATGVSETEQAKKIEDTNTFLERFKAEAAKRLKEVQKAEDAADEALLRFGSNIRNFLKDAVAVTAPDEDKREGDSVEVLFESKDPSSGKRVIHTSRFDAQLHVIHTTLTSFTQDPSGAGGQWDDFKKALDVSQQTDRIAADLEKFPELRASMEKVVPEKVEYKDFWTRYYFLRHVVEVQEEKRKELLKATTNDTEEVGWDEDSDDEGDRVATPHIEQKQAPATPKVLLAQNSNDSQTTLHQTSATGGASLRPEATGRRSHDEKSVADSDASYDLVSGATSRAPGSPKEEHARGKLPPNAEESDEDDWE